MALKKQPIVTLSTCQAGYVATSWHVCHTFWLRKLMHELRLEHHEATEIRVDNKSVIELAKNSIHHERSKHINARFHFIREHVKNEKVKMIHVLSHDQIADILAKPLPTYLFENLKKMIEMKDSKGLSLREEFVEH